jgi:3-oxoacyl-[acyl-carrier-protein] synthase II
VADVRGPLTAVAIVGQAWRTPLGRTVDGVVARVLAGDRAACASPRAAGYACSVVAPITEEPAKSRQSRFLRRMGLFGLEVAQEAFAAAKASGALDRRAAALDGDRIGLFAGVGGLRAHWDDMMKALANQADDGANAWERGLRDVHPYWMLRHLSNNVHALAAMELGLRGEGATYGGATGGAQAIAAAARALADGAIDAALVVAYDSLLEPETLVELGAKGAATLETDVARIASAYDARAAGFIPGEAAGALVLVRADDAPGAVRVAVADGADGEREEPTAAAIARAVRAVTERAGNELAVVDGAARAWPDRDAAERAMLAELIDPTTPLIAVSSALGQLGAATAVIQAIALGALLRARTLPPIAGLTSAASGPLAPVRTATPRGDHRAAIGVSTGAPGLYAAIRVETSS